MKYQIIGTGNTAWFLAKRLSAQGHKCIRVYGRNITKAKALADSVNTTATNKLSDIKDDADCCFIAISDHAIAEIAKQLSFNNTVLIHTAGSVDRSILSEAAPNNGVIWPIYSINKSNLPTHRDIPCIIEVANDESLKVISKLVNSITDKVYNVDSEQRAILHLSAVLSNNFVNHLFTISEKLCQAKDLPFALLLPIITQTSERIYHRSPEELQTGPAKRGDTATILKHLEILQEHSDWQEVYRSVTTSIDNLYRPNKEDKHLNY